MRRTRRSEDFAADDFRSVLKFLVYNRPHAKTGTFCRLDESRSNMRSLVLIAAAVAVVCGAEKRETSPRTIDELKAEISKILTETKTPGAGLAIVTRDGVIFAGGVGKADIAAGRPPTADTLFRIGSVSKAFAPCRY
jgi:CubicO group peptidase (beta-lactamase class C family)